MFDKLEEIAQKYEQLQNEMANPEIVKDINKMTNISKEIKQLEPIIAEYNDYLENKAEYEDAKKMVEVEKDSEIIEYLEAIIKEMKDKLLANEDKLKILLLPKDPNDSKNIIMEVRGAAGGDEANIFAGDLFRMYSRYAEMNGWKTEILEQNEAPNGGYSLISMLIKGEDVYSKLKFESGSHRVQRVPVTESQGRVHTSTATVVVMPEVDEVEVEINETDLKIDVMRSSGAGGQSVNTTDSAIRITHIPTNTVVNCQTERSQLQNKEQAMKVLRSRLYEFYAGQQRAEEDAARKSKLGTGDRSEKIRTYNYPQNRVTDHRIGLTLNKLDAIIEGKLDEIIEALIVEDQMEKMKADSLK